MEGGGKTSSGRGRKRENSHYVPRVKESATKLRGEYEFPGKGSVQF